MDTKHLFNQKRLKPFRSFLRNNSTSAEAVLWNKLKSKSLDGDPHGDPVQIWKDTIRDKYLEELGFTVLRFENRFVFQEPEFVLNEIKKFFQARLEF